jgi:hypothetical protein
MDEGDRGTESERERKGQRQNTRLRDRDAKRDTTTERQGCSMPGYFAIVTTAEMQYCFATHAAIIFG